MADGGYYNGDAGSTKGLMPQVPTRHAMYVVEEVRGSQVSFTKIASGIQYLRLRRKTNVSRDPSGNMTIGHIMSPV